MIVFRNNMMPVAAIVLALFIMLGLYAYDYYTWHVPLSSIRSSDIFYVDDYIVNYSDHSITPVISRLERIDKDTVEITFGKDNLFVGHGSTITHDVPNEFHHVMRVDTNDTFVAMCHFNTSDGIFEADIFQLAETHDTYAVFGHYSAEMPPDIRCKYPEIIRHSIDVVFPVPEPAHDVILEQ